MLHCLFFRLHTVFENLSSFCRDSAIFIIFNMRPRLAQSFESKLVE